MCNIPIPAHVKRKAREVNVEVDRGIEGNLLVTCNGCGQVWQVLIQSGGRRNPRGWWKCPNGCNTP